MAGNGSSRHRRPIGQATEMLFVLPRGVGVMRESPSIVLSNDQDVYLVLDDYGEWGTAWRETDVEDTDLESVITDLVEGQYINPVRVVGFNVSQGWVRDVSTD